MAAQSLCRGWNGVGRAGCAPFWSLGPPQAGLEKVSSSLRSSTRALDLGQPRCDRFHLHLLLCNLPVEIGAARAQVSSSSRAQEAALGFASRNGLWAARAAARLQLTCFNNSANTAAASCASFRRSRRRQLVPGDRSLKLLFGILKVPDCDLSGRGGGRGSRPCMHPARGPTTPRGHQTTHLLREQELPLVVFRKTDNRRFRRRLRHRRLTRPQGREAGQELLRRSGTGRLESSSSFSTSDARGAGTWGAVLASGGGGSWTC